MSLPLTVVDRLFQRLASTYGAAWVRQWSDVPMQDVKTAWGHELAGYVDRLEAIAWALERLPERCPNPIEFRNICRQAPAAATAAPQVPEAPADPARVAAELAKLAPVRAQLRGERHDFKGWARRIIARQARGEKIRPLTLRMAQEALRMSPGAEG